MLSLIFGSLLAHAALEPRPIDSLLSAQTIVGGASTQLKISFQSLGCSRAKVPVTYQLKLRQSKLRDTPVELRGGSVGRTIEADYDVTALVAEPTDSSCRMAFEDTVDLNELARKQGAMDFSQPDAAFDLRFHLTNKIAASSSIQNRSK